MELELQAALTRARRLKQKQAARPARDVANRVDEAVQQVKEEPVGTWETVRMETGDKPGSLRRLDAADGLVFTAMSEFVRGVGTEDKTQERRRSNGAEPSVAPTEVRRVGLRTGSCAATHDGGVGELDFKHCRRGVRQASTQRQQHQGRAY